MTASGTSGVDDEGRREDERHRAFARLFPNAKVNRPLETSPHPVGVVAARSWHRVSLALLLAGLAVIGEILLLSGPTSLIGFGWTPLVIGVGGVAAGVVGLAWSRYELRSRSDREHTDWATWATERGLHVVTPGTFTPKGSRRVRRAIGGRDLHVQPSRSFTPMYRATLATEARQFDVHIGTSFIHGPWGTITNTALGCVAVVIDLPADIGERLPASTLDRFVRGERPWSGRAGTKLRPLRLESADFDDACDLRVDAGSEDLEWYRLLDPSMLAGLARDWPISWQQHGSTLVVYMPAPAFRLDAVQLDTLCLSAAAIGGRFREIGMRADPIPEEVRQRYELQRATHRRRRIVQNIVSWVVVLAVLSVPIYIVTTLDAREDALRAAEIRERSERFQREYERQIARDRARAAQGGDRG